MKTHNIHREPSGALSELFASFNEGTSPQDPVVDSLLSFAQSTLEFRSGLAREDTPWDYGAALTTRQKAATLAVATQWNMLESTVPGPDDTFDTIVVLGAHKQTLDLRMQHAAKLYHTASELMILSCYRPIHPKEGVDQEGVETEADLGKLLLEDDFEQLFQLTGIEAWDDLPTDGERGADQKNAVAMIGRVGLTEATILCGSVPSGIPRATTLSTLETLKSYLGESTPRLLFVTTSLHLPYQHLQIEQVMNEFEYQAVGVAYPSMQNIRPDTPDSVYRMILQEIGGTIKTALGSK